MVRRLSSENHHRLEAFRDRVTIHTGDLLDQRSLGDVMRASEPDEIYNLAAMSFVGASWNQPTLTAEFTGVGVTRMLEAMREACPEARFYQASSSEMFGKVQGHPAERADPVLPSQPIWRGQGLRALHHGQLSRELRSLCLLRNPLQPREPTPQSRVRHPQDHPCRRGDQTRPGHRSWRWATSTPVATGVMRRTSSTRCGACSSVTSLTISWSAPGPTTQSGTWSNIAFAHLGLDPADYRAPRTRHSCGLPRSTC